MPALRIAAARPEDALELAALHVASWQSAYAGIIPAEHLAQLSVESRAARWRDILQRGEPCLVAWEDALLGEEASVGEEQELPQPGAAAGARAIGFVCFGKCRDADLPPTWGEIWAIYVRPSHWSRGAGQALWLHACAALRDRGFQDVSLWVLGDNERAIRFYRRAGLTPDTAPPQTIVRGGKSLVEVRYRAALNTVPAPRSAST